MLRDRLVFGIRDVSLKRKFSKEDPTVLTFDKLKQTCKIKETTEQQLKMLVPEEKSINKISRKEKKLCKFCVKDHLLFKKELCPAWGKTCSSCGGKNHIYRTCKKDNKKKLYQKDTRGKTKKNKRIKKIDKEDEEEESEEEAQILKISKINKLKKRKGRAKLKLRFEKSGKKFSVI